MIYKILKYFGYISNDDMLTIINETSKVIEADLKQEKDKLINIIKDKDTVINWCNKDIEYLESELDSTYKKNEELINLIWSKDDTISFCDKTIADIKDDLLRSNKKIEQLNTCIIKLKDKNKALSESNNLYSARASSAIKSRDSYKDKYNKLVWKIALQNATHK